MKSWSGCRARGAAIGPGGARQAKGDYPLANQCSDGPRTIPSSCAKRSHNRKPVEADAAWLDDKVANIDTRPCIPHPENSVRQVHSAPLSRGVNVEQISSNCDDDQSHGLAVSFDL